MKAEHRHELKTNELAEWIANFPQWFKDNSRTIIYVAVVGALVIGAYFYRAYQKNVVDIQKQIHLTDLIAPLPMRKAQILAGQAQGEDLATRFLQPANALFEAAQNEKNDHMHALELIKSAQILRVELHYGMETINDQLYITEQLNKARARYEQAIEKAAANPSLRAEAKFGVGLCEEELKNFEKAEQIYRDIINDDSLKGTTGSVQAAQRLEIINDYKVELVFKAAPPPPPPPPMVQPQVPENFTIPEQ